MGTPAISAHELADAQNAELLCDLHNAITGLEVGNLRKTDVWHILVTLRALARRECFDLRETFEDAMRFDPND